MQIQLSWRRLIARLLIATTTSLQIPQEPHAAPISTESAVVSDSERVLMLLEHPELRAQLQAYGVQPAEAKARVAALSDEEAAQLAAHIEEAPAGGHPAIAALLVAAGSAAIVLVAVAVGTIALVGLGVAALAKKLAS